MNEPYAVIIPTHGRPGRVSTHAALRRVGYTGDIWMLCDDGDKSLDAYKAEFPGRVLVFSKSDFEGKFDKMDNFGDLRCVVYARNAIYDAAKSIGLRYFVVADDDYTAIEYRITPDGGYYAKHMRNAEDVFSAYFDFLIESGIDTICFAQGGDFIGGKDNNKIVAGFKASRKMMNFYFFDRLRPIEFKGTINEDLTSSVTHGVTGGVILTSLMNSIVQRETQSNKGGLTDIYKAVGTYTKSFYSVIAAPSCIKVSVMGDGVDRLHHQVTWKNAVPVIIRESLKKRKEQ